MRQAGMIVWAMPSPYPAPPSRAAEPRTCSTCGEFKQPREYPLPSVRARRADGTLSHTLAVPLQCLECRAAHERRRRRAVKETTRCP